MGLLAYLANTPGFHRRDSLLALFWPELDDAHARSALNQALRFLRKELGRDPDSIIVSRGAEEVGVNGAHLSCDAAAFQDLLDSGRTAEALPLYRGDLLHGFFVDDAAGFEDWLDRRRASLRSRALAAMEEVAQDLHKHAKPAQALHVARSAIALFGIEEPAMRRLMRLAETIADRGAVLDVVGAPGIAADMASDPASSDTTTRRFRGVRSTARLAALGVLAVAAAGAWGWRSPPNADTGSAIIAVMPFSIRAPDSSYDFLREGIVDLMYVRLSDESGSNVIRPSAIVRAYRLDASPSNGALSERAARGLAERMGAGQLMTGELIATPHDVVMSARLLDVKTGRLIVSHVTRGAKSQTELATRLADGMVAKMLGDSPSRLDALSHHPEAVRAYLVGLRFHRNSRPGRAVDAFNRALEIDSTFAAAAFWRAYVGWGPFAFGTPERRRVDSAAWALRAGLRRGDSLMLVALASIGPNYPNPSTAMELLQALERAARFNRHRPEAWTEWARHLLYWGSQAGVPNSLGLATFVVDSAIALDSTFSPALVLRFYLSIVRRDIAAVRAFRDRLDALEAGRDPAFRWAAANVLNENAALPRLFDQMAGRPSRVTIPRNVELWASSFGISSVEDAERFVTLRLTKVDVTDEERRGLQAARARIAALRGQRQRALHLMDSIATPHDALTIAIAEDGYDTVAERAARASERRAEMTMDKQERANALCETQVWRVAKGDTSGARGAVALMRTAIAATDPAPGWRVGRLGLCPALLEAMLEHASDTPDTAARSKLRALLLEGTMSESPGNVAYLTAARMFAARGDRQSALELIRRRDPMAGHMIQPAAWRLEGDWALSQGDTSGAIHAYARYLEIRDRPDDGALRHESRRVKRVLDDLTSSRTNR